MLDKKSNSPFEVEENNEYGSTNKQTDSRAGKPASKTSNSNKAKVILVIYAVICTLYIVNDLRYVFYQEKHEMAQKMELSKLDDYVVEDYVYDFNDFKISENYDLFPKEIPQGEEFTISPDNDKYIERLNSVDLMLVVGRDIEPGLYTIIYEGGDFLAIDQTLVSFSPNEPGTYYNIPLVEGDTIKSSYYSNESNEFTHVFKPQTDYVEYQDGYNGIFAYGRSNFNPNVEISAEDKKLVEYNYESPKDNMRRRATFYDEDATLNGVPGSYFIIKPTSGYQQDYYQYKL
ncbi:hypothetical protein RZE82_07410 [Mollicutes bacterium LVI A0039]|nr:hypothetical protein RZE82_07410 [Mollicutes bacterium LVI A0039]